MRATPLPGTYIAGNQVLDALGPFERAAIEPDVRIVELAAHAATNSAGGVIDYVDFPIDAVLSVVARLKNGDTVEVGTIGSEGFVESDAALDSELSQRTSFCQVGGTVARMSIERFEAQMAENGNFAHVMRRNVRAALFTAQQFAACNVKHTVLQRTARWLSMTEDRVGHSHFVLSKDFLAIMLGVRPAAVSEATGSLEASGALTYVRGEVTVLNRALLNVTACECYAACKLAYTASLRE